MWRGIAGTRGRCLRHLRRPAYALRLHEAGLIRSSPQKLIAQSADWRFLAELKQELKG